MLSSKAPEVAIKNRAIPALLSSLWQKYLPLMQERLAALDLAAAGAKQGQLDPNLRLLAVDAAHKFAGSLGMFGFAEGTDAARSLEHLLLQKEPFDESRFRRLVEDLHRVLGF